MLTAAQIESVRTSFAHVLPITDAVAADFYGRLFAIAPDTRRLFHGDMTDQGRKLFLTLATVVDSLDDLASVLPVASALAVRHVGYGVQDAHYAAVGAALVGALEHALGDAFDHATRDGWSAAYATLSSHMIAAARGVADAA